MFERFTLIAGPCVLEDDELAGPLLAIGVDDGEQIRSVGRDPLEENAAVRQRRLTETDKGPESVRGSFAETIARAAQAGVPAETLPPLIKNSETYRTLSRKRASRSGASIAISSARAIVRATSA